MNIEKIIIFLSEYSYKVDILGLVLQVFSSVLLFRGMKMMNKITRFVFINKSVQKIDYVHSMNATQNENSLCLLEKLVIVFILKLDLINLV